MLYILYTRDMSLKNVLNRISKKYGEWSAMFFWDLDKVEVKKISTWLPSLDRALGGWLPEWRIIEIYWPPSSGKTTLAIKFLAEVQKAYPEKAVAFIDVEHALDPDYAEVLWLKMDELIFAQPTSAEEALDIVHELADSWEVRAIIIDSVAKLTPKKEVEWNIWDAEMAMRARLMSQALRKITPKANQNQCTCFFINQVRTNVGQMYGNPETRPWGNALPFDASVIIRTSSKKIDELTGETRMMIKKNKVGKPFRETTVRISYGKGYDYLQDVITTAKDTEVIKRAGSIYSYGEHKWKGETLMREEIAQDENLQKEIEKAIKDKSFMEHSIEKKKS